MIFTSLLRPNLMFITEQNDDKGTTILSIFCNSNKPVVKNKKKKKKKKKEEKPTFLRTLQIAINAACHLKKNT